MSESKNVEQALINTAITEDEKYIDDVCQALLDGITFKDIHDIPESTMQGIYAYAYEFYHQGKLDEAETFFRFLSIYDFYNSDYVMGLAAVYQLKKRFDKATELYALAFMLAKDDYRPLFHAGQCNLMLKKTSAALHCFETTVINTTNAELKQKAQAYLSALKQNLEENRS
ncbi:MULTISPECIES: type III secretion system translocator chaperone SicA [Yersinia]|uniref:type III secretion system translocator chaperone SicA n=1 Tax=Yersinia TaxID=629 RepID=UPI0007E48119|nr:MULTISPECIES: type III secretion system translocator chaperone SicA [Yersinia]OWF88693.1 CesD/SycD/LcrH family type III secretion system chaperone [Yersinia entomophaga]